ncbi:1,4-dihydroxy-2-naphthoate polyprenyltransferase [Calidifontibacillus erzurumensis]|uniref:1,4-dihydroxy-2-naphthoate octaprenyltransferase n=1 Tax=Calidifontibacillus erzurumensis TaxID=2741433 RepID=A0A8J8GD73_9BACI|nr:1,4-dihydroxy-2-naphthoate polyprenyltransferase [Calidifontibacillus erzurumensis]NSL51374.1 1,4-dihydroxy-2-naphthoate polyprenyltransferase [Calidifontibacillus erzurumensis]
MQTEHRINVKNKKESSWKTWYRQLRPHTLTASFVPVSIGTALALLDGSVNILLFLAMLIASLLIQAATNLFNEYYDYKRGLDNADSIGIGGGIVRDGIAPKTILNVACGFFAIAILLGLYICANSSWWIAAIGIVCMITAYFYTGGPFPIAYSPFGEIVAGFFMGVVIILIAYFIQVGSISLESILISIPISILIGAILLSNNIRDLDGDKKSGRRTLAILVGREKAIRLLAFMFAVSYGWILVLIFAQIVSPWLLIVFGSLPKAVQAVRGFHGKTQPIQMMPAMKATAQTNTHFGFLVAFGLLLSYWI